jgi:two-component sensor histidine kinase
MASLQELARSSTRLPSADIAHLQRLVGSWGMLADFCFSDLLLLAPTASREGHRFVVVGQVRPTTGQTLYREDVLSAIVDEVERPLVARAWRLGETIEGETLVLGGGERARVRCIPVRHQEHLVGIVTRETATTIGRRPGELERVYLEIFDRFARMIAEGTFPFADTDLSGEAPRVGDGAIVLDADARVRYASPNAISSIHRMGIHANTQGLSLGEVGFDDDGIRTAYAALSPVTEEIERGDTSLLVRVIPVLDGDGVDGAVVLVRDVSELRRRDRLLLSKDATIREIHHRVKNNLQTIASLLRLQARRLSSTEAKQALEESVRRIRSIALVHETLAYAAGEIVPFGEVIRPLVRVVEDGLLAPERRVAFSVEGDPGDLPAEVATPLAVVLTELLQNAVEHAFPREGGYEPDGHVWVVMERTRDEVVVDVSDDGVGLPDDFAPETSKGLGLSIVHTLVTTELSGSITMTGTDGGTRVQLRVPVTATPKVER